MKTEHEVTINDLRHRHAHVQAQEQTLREQRTALQWQLQEVETKLADVQHENHRISYAIKAIEGIILPVKPQQEYDAHDKH